MTQRSGAEARLQETQSRCQDRGVVEESGSAGEDGGF